MEPSVMADPDVEQRLRELELEMNVSAPLPEKTSTKVKSSDPDPARLGALGPWKWVLAGLGVIVGLGLVLRLLDLALKLAIVGAIGYGLYRWVIAPKLPKHRTRDTPPH